MMKSHKPTAQLVICDFDRLHFGTWKCLLSSVGTQGQNLNKFSVVDHPNVL